MWRGRVGVSPIQIIQQQVEVARILSTDQTWPEDYTTVHSQGTLVDANCAVVLMVIESGSSDGGSIGSDSGRK